VCRTPSFAAVVSLEAGYCAARHVAEHIGSADNCAMLRARHAPSSSLSLMSAPLRVSAPPPLCRRHAASRRYARSAATPPQTAVQKRMPSASEGASAVVAYKERRYFGKYRVDVCAAAKWPHLAICISSQQIRCLRQESMSPYALLCVRDPAHDYQPSIVRARLPMRHVHVCEAA